MLELKTKKELSGHAHTLGKGSQLVRYRNVTYMPVDFETPDTTQVPAKERTIWLPLSRSEIRQLAADTFDTLFANDGELSSFDFMVAQNAQQVNTVAQSLLVRTPEGLRLLTPKGELGEPTGDFVPNTLVPMLNTNAKDKAEIVATVAEWLDSEEEAKSLFYHLASSLSPGWPAVKYVLLLGEGRNGKGTLLKMLLSVFGRENASSVTRQDMSERSPTVTELNGKLLNLVFDGLQEYLKDSGTEKTLIAGEPAPIRRLYDSAPTIVETNALFVEALNSEPKSKDKSSALQKRLVRFQFPNVYALDHKFGRHMLSERMLGAFLAVLIDHHVQEDEVAEKLAPTKKSVELQLEHAYVNSLALQFLKYVVDNDTLGIDEIIGAPLTKIVGLFQSWRVKENDLATWAEPDVLALFNPLINSERKSLRDGGSVKKVRHAVSLKPEALQFLESLEGEADDTAQAALVAD